jgi:DNA-binding NtrC family response regulator
MIPAEIDGNETTISPEECYQKTGFAERFIPALVNLEAQVRKPFHDPVEVLKTTLDQIQSALNLTRGCFKTIWSPLRSEGDHPVLLSLVCTNCPKASDENRQLVVKADPAKEKEGSIVADSFMRKRVVLVHSQENDVRNPNRPKDKGTILVVPVPIGRDDGPLGVFVVEDPDFVAGDADGKELGKDDIVIAFLLAHIGYDAYSGALHRLERRMLADVAKEASRVLRGFLPWPVKARIEHVARESRSTRAFLIPNPPDGHRLTLYPIIGEVAAGLCPRKHMRCGQMVLLEWAARHGTYAIAARKGEAFVVEGRSGFSTELGSPDLRSTPCPIRSCSILVLPIDSERRIICFLWLERDPPDRFTHDEASELKLELDHTATRIVVESVATRQRPDRDFVAFSSTMLQIHELVLQIANYDTPVLIQGGSGTGKELVARLLHKYSYRSQRPFVAVNLSALSQDVLESELYGHVRGAFTGAIADNDGRLSAVGEGTLYLDDVDSLSPTAQVKLLRVLEERVFEPVGSLKEKNFDGRLVVSTNKDLEALVREDKFREDLYYRLAVERIEVPPLCRHKEDIRHLVNHWLGSGELRKHGKRIRTEEVFLILERYDWPGNVRQLRNCVETMVRKSGTRDDLGIDDIPDEIRVAEDQDGESELARVERQTILRAMKDAGGNVKKAAEILKMPIRTLYEKLSKLGYKPEDFHG